MNLLSGVSTNVVQSIRAFRISELQEDAAELGQHFLYAYCGEAKTKEDVLREIGRDFGFPPYFGHNFDALYDCLTDSIHKAGKQNGFVVVIEQLPFTEEFDRDAREILIDVFRDAAEYWGKRQIPFRMFYSFA